MQPWQYSKEASSGGHSQGRCWPFPTWAVMSMPDNRPRSPAEVLQAAQLACVFARQLACIFVAHFSPIRTPKNLGGRKICVWKTHARWHPRAWSMKRNLIKNAFLHVFWGAFSTHDFLEWSSFFVCILHASLRLGCPSICQREEVCGRRSAGGLRRRLRRVCRVFSWAVDGPSKTGFYGRLHRSANERSNWAENLLWTSWMRSLYGGGAQTPLNCKYGLTDWGMGRWWAGQVCIFRLV